MEYNGFHGIDLTDLPTPLHLIHLGVLEDNLKVLGKLQEDTGVKVLLALKAYALWKTFPLLRRYLSGVCASGAFEAKLGRECFGKEVHTFSPAYTEDEFRIAAENSDYILFNSVRQLELYRERTGPDTRIGLRVNPGCSVAKESMYDPCASYSRLGIPAEELEYTLRPYGGKLPEEVSGLHFHALCEQGADELERVLSVFERNFAHHFPQIQWVNWGGGHHITREGYDLGKLYRLISDFSSRHRLRIYMEPGEAVVLNAGVLVCSVVDIVRNKMDVAVVDTSAEAHNPDILASSSYRPEIAGAGLPGEYPYTYRIGGMTCLAGDILGDYSFPEPLQPGQRLVFLDTAYYTMVKSNMFNGINLPGIALYHPGEGEAEIIRRFGYEDYKNRLS